VTTSNRETPSQVLKRYLLAELKVDDEGLWSVVLTARDVFHAGPGEVRDVVLNLLRDLLENGDVVVGFPTKDGVGFRAWRATPDDAIARIGREWSELGRDPDIAEVAWVARRGRPHLEYED
jgi:hypothetical protein